jgi:cytochrome c oxidase assembly factor CtaG
VGWLLDPSLLSILVVVGVLLYALGLRRRLATGRRRAELWRRTGLLAVAVVLLDLVLCPAFDRYAAESQAMHMLQHVVLMAIVPPLVVVAAPWLTVWRALPLDARRSTARAVLLLPAGVRRALRGLVSPVVAFVLVSANLALWHIPALYDLTLRNAVVHDLEHATFLLFGTFYWLALLDSPPLRSRLDNLQRAIYAGAGMVTGWLLALVLAFASTPLYSAYADLPRRLGGISALSDQQLAAGVMLGIASIPYTVAVFVFVYRWLDAERPDARRRASASLTS